MGFHSKLSLILLVPNVPTRRFVSYFRVHSVLLLVLGACSMEASVSGLKPISPTQYYSVTDKALEFAEVQSLQPTLSWEPFPGRHEWPLSPLQPEPFVSVNPSRVSNVTYDLIIWNLDAGNATDVIYERQGVPETCHTLEEPLAPSTQYYWSVRPRFELDGQTRVSAWSLTTVPWYPGRSPRVKERNHSRIPSLNYYRFETPQATNSASSTGETAVAACESWFDATKANTKGFDGPWFLEIGQASAIHQRDIVRTVVSDGRFSAQFETDGWRGQIRGEINEDGSLVAQGTVEKVADGGNWYKGALQFTASYQDDGFRQTINSKARISETFTVSLRRD